MDFKARKDDDYTNSSASVSEKGVKHHIDDHNYIYDTIHYLSPATTARTVNEGDFDYYRFLPHMLTDADDLMPAYSSSESDISCEYIQLQRTIAIIKPEAMVHQDVVLREINLAGFKILHKRLLHLSPEQVTELYIKEYGCPSFPNKVISMSMGPLLVLSMARIDAIEKWKSIIGPNSMLKSEWFMPILVRTRFGLQPDLPDALHASNNMHESTKENRYFYPDVILEPLSSDGQKVEDYCAMYINSTLLNGLTELVRVKPVDPVIYLAEWLLNNNPFKPKQPYSYAMAST